MKWVLMVVLLLAGCEAERQDLIVSKEKIELPDTVYSKSTEAYKITYLSDELEIAGFMVSPKNIEDDLPLLIYNRGGNQEYGKIDREMLSKYLSLWANKGYIVLASQYRGNDGGEGQEEFGGSDVKDVSNLLKAADELPNVDTDNAVMLGRSRGGMMTYLAIKEGVNIKAAAVEGGITDLFSQYERNTAMRQVLNDLIGNPNQNEDTYKSRSAVYWPDEIDVPLLMLHGGEDWKVPVEQARELRDKLSEQDAEFEYIEYEEGDHGLTNHMNEYIEKVNQWFQEHID
ncbi:S9 family peptidase [Halobacillus sp. A5]|uniref:alpha/beta hydrolase family protein n=1 Tax=Halobacillus sp. A5 TaxID=2880263 RepID=UPI0020A628EB|nr:prolyl oligopeptidase family serine peptidase [Halobacillus sp. A5]MCP3026433.1 prolyl oligopeptidase family serine peptidase [Halobacillus sp. A5]